jgi:hypothetical protein
VAIFSLDNERGFPMRLLRDCKSVLIAMQNGNTMTRGCNGGWYVRDQEGFAVARVLDPAATDAMASMKLERIDDMATVCGEEWGKKPDRPAKP